MKSSDLESIRWLPVVGWEGVYAVSELGEIQRLVPGRSTYPGHLISGSIDAKGYRRTSLSFNGRFEAVGFHRVVCRAFHGPAPAGKAWVLHWDGNPSNNNADNLRWGDASENSADSKRHGTSYNAGSTNRDKTHCPRNHAYTTENTRRDSIGRRSCRACRREDWSNAPVMADDDPRHGTYTGYSNGKCRCAPCKSTYAAYRRDRRARQHDK